MESSKAAAAENAPVVSPDKSVPPDAWPVFRGDAASQGVAASSLPEQLDVIWKRPFKGGIFEATAAIVDGAIYIGSLDGPFYALDLATGNERWRFPTELGFRAPAAVRNNRVYVGDTEGRFYCLDAKTGKPIWTLQTGAEINAGANFYKDNVLVGSQDGTLYCLRASDGKLVWKYTIENMIQCMPTVAENRAFLAGCDGLLHIVNLDNGEKVSTLDILDPTGVTPAAVGDRVYFATQGARVFCVNWRKPEVLWTYEPRRKQPFQSSPAVAKGIVVVGGRDRAIHAIDAEKGGEKGGDRWTFPTRSRVDSSPVVVGERVFVGTGDGHLYGLKLASGERVWEYEAGGDFTASPAVAQGVLVIGNGNGDLYCFGKK